MTHGPHRAAARTLACAVLAVIAAVRGASAPAQARGAAGAAGVVVESATAGYAPARAGLQAGDSVTAWRRGSRQGVVASPFDLLALEFEQAPLGNVRLIVQRSGPPQTLTVPPGRWSLWLRPSLEDADLERYHAGLAHARAGRGQEAQDTLQPLADALQRAGRQLDAAWAWLEAGRGLTRARQANAAREAFGRARRLVPAEPLAEARIWRIEAESVGATGDRAGAAAAWERARALLEKTAPGSLLLADLLIAEGTYHRRTTLDLARAEAALREALTLTSRLAPRSHAEAWCHYSIAAARFARGDVEQAERGARAALGLHETFRPEDPDLEAPLDLLGLIAHDRGDLARAEQLYRRARGLAERYFAGQREEVVVLNHLGVLYRWRGELEAAQAVYERALAVAERAAPDSPEVAGTLNNLGNIAEARRDLAQAEALHRRAFALREKLSPGSPDVASSLINLGIVRLHRGDRAGAERSLGDALNLIQRALPGNQQHANSLYWLGELRREEGNWPEARRLYGEALELRRRLGPGTGHEADVLQRLAAVARAEGHPDEAVRHLCAAVDALDVQRGRLGASADGTGFAARFAPIYRDAVEALAAVDRSAEAFAMLERSRARSLLALIAERDVVVPGVPPELESRRRQAEAEYDRTLDQLGRLAHGKDDARIAELAGQLAALREARAVIAAELRQQVPGAADLRDPQPLGLDAARKALDADTVLLSYSVGDERTLLFVVQPAAAEAPAEGGLTVVSIPIGLRALADRVFAFRGLIEQSRRGPVPAFESQARSLYAALVRPAESVLAGSARVLLCPDGPLRTLPFAALMREGSPRFLGEWKPLHHALSATLYAEIRKAPRPAPSRRGPLLVAFGDPVFRRSEATTPNRSRAGLSSQDLPALPYTRREVQTIAGVFKGEAEAHLGGDASEERARAVGREPRIVHFATHALLDRRFPLDSALALSTPAAFGQGGDNGLLQAWEILEKLRLDADLVTLSACDTGLGGDAGGEGIVGLMRAFQFAGARSVLASLWSVSEGGTARLMESFYRSLRAGRTKDEALQAAQADAIRAGRPPFEWGAFQLSGDWR